MSLGLILIGALALVAVMFLLSLSRRSDEVVSQQLPEGRSPLPGDGGDIEALVRAGQKIAAIKRYRQRYGGGLKEAKEAIDALEAGGTLPAASFSSSPEAEVSDEGIEREIRAGNLISAIRMYRAKTGSDLKEAKEAVEAWRDRLKAG